MFDFLNPYTY